MNLRSLCLALLATYSLGGASETYGSQRFMNFARYATAAAAHCSQAFQTIKQSKQIQWVADHKVALTGTGIAAGVLALDTPVCYAEKSNFNALDKESLQEYARKKSGAKRYTHQLINPRVKTWDEFLNYFFSAILAQLTKTSWVEEAAIPKEKKKELTELFKSHGFTTVLFLIDKDDKDKITHHEMPIVKIIALGKSVAIFFTENAERAYGNKPTKISVLNDVHERNLKKLEATIVMQGSEKIALLANYFNSEHMDAALIHELGHAIHKHAEKTMPFHALNLLLKQSPELSLMYELKMHNLTIDPANITNLKNIDALRSLIVPISLFLGAHLFAMASLSKERAQEREADKNVIKTNDKKMIMASIDLGEKASRLVGCKYNDQKVPRESLLESLYATHPSYDERIAYFKKALKKLTTKERLLFFIAQMFKFDDLPPR